jgi:CheY-like chemotaxis protein
MTGKSDKRRTQTQKIIMPESVPAGPPSQGTGPLDYAMPWIMELRVVGTPSVLQVEVKESMAIGRTDKDTNTTADIDLAPYRAYQNGVSRRHATISARNSRITIRDEGSSNGTFVNGARLDPNQYYRLRHGDTVSFGKLAVQVFFVVTPSSHEKHDSPFSEVIIPTIGNGHRVLIVEDDEKVARALGSVLEQAGFVYSWQGNVTNALIEVDEKLPSLMLLELMLPDRSGIELIDYVRNQPGGETLPLIVVSSASGGYQMGQAIEAGADVFLTKPVGVDELLRGVSKVIAESQA